MKEGIVALRSLASIGTNERKQEKGKRENWEREKKHQQFKKPNQTEQEKKKCVYYGAVLTAMVTVGEGGRD